VSAVRILRIAAGGDGVGKLPDGRTVFVPRTAPGDLVELSHLTLHDRFARARLGDLIEAGAGRVPPACPHYEVDECGGCQLQHLAAEQQIAAKRAMTGDALRRIGRFEIEDPEIVPAPEQWGYREKLTLAVAGGGERIGLHRYDRPGELFDLERCLITSPALMDLWQVVRRARGLLPAGARSLILRRDRSGGRHVIVKVAEQKPWSNPNALHKELASAGVPAVLWWMPMGGAARVVAGSREAYPATVFEQVHPRMGDQVREFAIDQLGAIDHALVWDLYAGIGETTSALLAKGARVESVELDSRAVRHSDGEGPADPRVVRHAGYAEELVRRMKRPEFVITNPPRTGMDRAVVDAIRSANPRRVVYVSCDAATLARDLARLLAGSAGRLVALKAFDLFPQTAHAEAVALVERG
jgi:23S rRNA (uracil1939-C5)-methyltransferase